MGIGLREAEGLTGLGRSSLLKAIKAGKLSASRGTNGSWEVEIAELQRVYALKVPDTGSDRAENGLGTAEVERDLLRQQLRMMEDTVSDLRARLTRSDEERTRLTLMLTQGSDRVVPSIGDSPTRDEKKSEPSVGYALAVVLVVFVGLVLALLVKVSRFLP